MASRHHASARSYPQLAIHLHDTFGAGFERPLLNPPIGVPPPFYRTVLDCIDSIDLDYLNHITHKRRASHWHVVDLFDERFDRSDNVEAAPSLNDGIAAVIDAALHARVRLHEMRAHEGGFDFYGLRGRLASVRPIQYAQPMPQLVTRVQTALKGVGKYEIARAVARLHRVPGLQCLADADRADLHRPIYLYPIHSTAANIATALKQGFESFLGLNPTVSAVQQALARAIGADNWATLISFEARPHYAHRPVAVFEREQQPHTDRSFYVDVAAGLAGLALSAKRIQPSRLIVSSVDTISAWDDRWSESKDEASRLSMHSPAEATPDEKAKRIAAAVLVTPDRLTRFFALKPRQPTTTVAPFDATRSQGNADVLYLGPRIFTRHHQWQETLLQVETVDENGEAQPGAPSFLALYKAHIAVDGARAAITADYNRRTWISLDHFESGERKALLTFMGPRFVQEHQSRLFSLPSEEPTSDSVEDGSIDTPFEATNSPHPS